MTSSEKGKASNELQLAEAKNRNPKHYQGETMNTIINDRTEAANPFDARFVIDAELGPITIESEADYSARFGGQEAVILAGLDLVRIDGQHGPIHLDPAEALQVAVAIQAVAIDLLEQQPREIHRNTEPGAPAFEEGI